MHQSPLMNHIYLLIWLGGLNAGVAVGQLFFGNYKGATLNLCVALFTGIVASKLARQQ